VRVAVESSWTPGTLAYLQIDERVPQTGGWVPDTAVTEGLRGTWVAYIAVPAGDGLFRLEARSVVIHHADSGKLFVSGALAEGDQVVTGGLQRLAPGQLVRLAEHDRVTRSERPDARANA
jgi:multidrug efflux pump subunit AcrA (membrane-fusion protein)